MVDVRRLGVKKVQNVNDQSGLESQSVILSNFVAIRQTVAEIWRFTIFQYRGRPPACIVMRVFCLDQSRRPFSGITPGISPGEATYHHTSDPNDSVQ